MTTSVDTRVVEMQFDNASFQKGVAETLTSLDSLSDKLDSKQSYKGLDSLKNAINGVSFDSIGSGLDGLLSKASSVFSGITGIIGNFGKTVGGVSGIAAILTGGGALLQAITGGSQRATNIENAKFMLEGLRADWNALSKDINYAVEGTAYGFDAAAMAAANLTASGVQAGGEMSRALRAVSGVAAQTNSDYESIAHIFTTIAGNGRLMTEQLNQFAYRGLNAAAALAEVWGITEQEVRDLAHEGAIDFQTFADAMDSAFGEHAKEANKTFTGAVANMKAALNKIGADFFTPIHELERQTALGFRLFFNSIREGFNDTRSIWHWGSFGDEFNKEFAGMNSTVGLFALNMGFLGEDINKAFQNLYDSNRIQGFVSSFTWLNDAFFHGTWKNMSAIITTIFDKLSNVDISSFANAMHIAGEALFHFSDITAAQIPMVIDILGNLLGSVLNVFSAIGTFLSPVFDALGGAFANLMDIGTDGASGFLEMLVGWTQNLQDFTSKLSLSAEDMEAVKSVFTKVFDALGSVAKPIGDLLGQVGSALGDAFGSILPMIGPAAETLASVLTPAIETLCSAISAGVGWLSEFVKGIVEFVKSAVDLNAVGDFFKSIADAVSGVAGSIDFSSITNFFSSFKIDPEQIKAAGAALGELVNHIREFFSYIGGGIASGTSSISTFFDSLTNSIGKATGVSKAYADEGAPSLSKALKRAASDMAKSGDEVVESTGSVFDKVTEFINGFTTNDAIAAVSAVASGLMLGTGLKIAKNISDVIKHTGETIGGINDLIASAKGVLDAVSQSIEGFAKALNKQATAEIIKSVGISLALLAGSLFLLSLINPERLWGAVGAMAVLGVLLGGLIAAIVALNKWMTKGMGEKEMLAFASNMAAFAAAMLSMAVAIGVLSLSVALLSLVDPGRLGAAVASVLLLMLSVTALAYVVGKMDAAAASLFGFAAAMAAIGLAIIPLVASVIAFSMLPTEQVVAGIAELVLMIVLIEKVIETLGKSLTMYDAANIFGFAAAMLAIGAAIIPLTAAVVILGSLPLGSLALGVGAVAAMMLVMAASVRIMTKALTLKVAGELLAISVTLLAFASSMVILAAAMAMMSTIPDLGPALKAIAILAVIFTAMSVITTLLTDGLDLVALSIGLVAFGAAMLELSAAMAILSALPSDGLQQAVIAIVELMAAFTIMTVIMAVVPGVTVALLALGIACLSIGGGMILAGLGIMAVATALVTLAAIGPATAQSISTSMQIMADGIGKSMVEMAGHLAEAIVLFGTTLSQHSGEMASSTAEIGKSAAVGLGQAAPEFANAGVQAIVAFAQGIGAQAGALASAGLLIIENLLIGIASGIGGVIDAAAKVAIGFINGVADAIRANAGLLMDAVGNVAHTIFGMLEGFIADGLEAIFGPNPVADWIRQNADEQIAEAEACSQRVNEAISSKNDEMVENQKDTMSQMTQVTSDGTQDISSAAENGFNDILTNADEIMAQLPPEAQEYLGGTIDTITGMTGDFQSAGEELGQAEVKGTVDALEAGEGEVYDGGVELAESAKEGAGSVDMSDTGANFAGGFVAGIESRISDAITKAREMVAAAKQAADSEAEIKSPSRVMMRSGSYFAEGFAIGIMNGTGEAVAAATEMVAQSKAPMDGIAIAMSSMFDDINWDANPVITPVLDTSLVEDGMKGLFPENQLVGAANLSRAFGGGYSNNESVRYGDQYHFNLNYDKSNDGNDILMDIARYMRTRSLMGA